MDSPSTQHQTIRPTAKRQNALTRLLSTLNSRFSAFLQKFFKSGRKQKDDYAPKESADGDVSALGSSSPNDMVAIDLFLTHNYIRVFELPSNYSPLVFTTIEKLPKEMKETEESDRDLTTLADD